MTLDEQIDKALEELVYCGRDTVGVTDEAVLARKAIRALIATQIQEARIEAKIDELERYTDAGASNLEIYERIDELRSTQ